MHFRYSSCTQTVGGFCSARVFFCSARCTAVLQFINVPCHFVIYSHAHASCMTKARACYLTTMPILLFKTFVRTDKRENQFFSLIILWVQNLTSFHCKRSTLFLWLDADLHISAVKKS